MYTDELTNKAGDFIKTVDVFSSFGIGNSDFNYKYENSTDINSIQIFKNYLPQLTLNGDSINPYSQNLERDVTNFWSAGDKSEVTLDGGRIFRNEVYSPYDKASSVKTLYHGFGQKTVVLKLDGVIHSSSLDPTPFIGDLNITTALGPEITGVSVGSNGVTAFNDGGYNGATRGFNHYIINYKRDLTGQYGGNTFNTKSLNLYINTGCNIKVNEDYTPSPIKVFGGDTFMTVMDCLKYRKSWEFSSPVAPQRRSQTYLFPVESPIHTEYRHGRHVQSHGFVDQNSGSLTERGNTTLTGCTDLGEDYFYNQVFSSENNVIEYFAKPFDFQSSDCTNYFDSRIAASEPKVNGEVLDSWRNFRTNEFIDLESLNGPINKVEVLNDTFYALQDTGISVISVNPRVQTTTTDGGSLELGTGGVLHTYTYLSTSIGCKHQWGVIPSRSHLYWVDINNNKMYKLGSDGLMPLSDFKGMFSYLEDNLVQNVRRSALNSGDNPIENAGITGYYDYKNNEVVFTFLGLSFSYDRLTSVPNDKTYIVGDMFTVNGIPYIVIKPFTYNTELSFNNLRLLHSLPSGFTLCYNEYVQQFTSFYSFESPMYFYNPSTLFSVDNNSTQDIYLHNVGERGNFYGFVNDSKIHLYVNDLPVYTKVFDNFMWHTESTLLGVSQNDTFYNLNCNTTYQDTGDINLNTLNLKRKERTWQSHVPRSSTNRERLRDKHLEVKLNYDNTPNNRFLVHLFGCSFRPSYR
jgi:hypothetical protein